MKINTLSLITFLEDDVYSPIAIVEDQAFIEDIKINGQTANVFLTGKNSSLKVKTFIL